MKFIGLICLLFSLSCVDPKVTYMSESKEIHAAMRLLWKDNPESLRILKAAHAKGVHLKIKMGDLKGATLGTTHVTQDSAVVTIDVGNINQVQDNVVPVLAHEIFHIRDAFLVMGPEAFMAAVAKDKNEPWNYRTVEIMAIKSEDELRLRLLTQNPRAYRGMCLTRADANRRAGIFAPGFLR